MAGYPAPVQGLCGRGGLSEGRGRRARGPRSWGLVLALIGLLVACGRPAGLGPRRVVGRPGDPECLALLARLPLQESAAEARLRLFDRTYLWRECALVATLADPRAEGDRVTLVTSPTPERVDELLARGLGPERPGLRLYLRGELELEARLGPRGDLRDGEVIDHGARRGWPGLAERAPARRGWRVQGLEELAPELVEAILGALESTVERLAWAGVERPRVLDVVVADAADALRDDRPAQAGGRYAASDRRWVVAGDPALASDGARVVARELLVQALGPPRTPWLADAAALEASGSCFGVELERWCAHLARGGAGSLEELLARGEGPPSERSPLVLQPLRAWLWRLVRISLGEEELIVSWRAGIHAQRVAPLWRAEIERLAALRDDDPRAARPPAIAGGGAIVDLPIDAVRGIGTRSARRALERAARAGARLVVLRAHLAPPAPEGWTEEWPADGGIRTREGDAALLWGMRQARALGLAVALAPEVLSSASGVRDGERVLTRPEEWDAYFRWTEAALEHAALLAELGGAQLLSLGGGIPEAARSSAEPDLDERTLGLRRARAERWGAIATRTRARFRGALTFRAESSGHARQIAFRDELDLLWIPFLPELGLARPWPADDPLLVDLLDAHLERALEPSGDGAPPVWLEVGFRAIPRSEQGAGPSPDERDEEAQARLFRLLAAALERRAAAGARAPAGLLVRGFGSLPSELDPRAWGIEGRAAQESLRSLWR